MESLEKKKIKLCRKAVSSEIFDGRWQFMRFMKHEIKKGTRKGKDSKHTYRNYPKCIGNPQFSSNVFKL